MPRLRMDEILVDSCSSAYAAVQVQQVADVEIFNSTFHNNSAVRYSGGALHCTGGQRLRVKGCTFSANTNRNGMGGALGVDHVLLVHISDTLFDSN